MGRIALLLVLAFFIGVAFTMFGQQKAALHTDQQQDQYQEALLAQQTAKAGLNMAVSQAKRDFDAWRTGFDQTPYDGGAFDVNLQGSAAGPIQITADGTFGQAQHRAQITLARLAPSPAALLIDADTVEASLIGSDFLISGRDSRPGSGVTNRREGNGSGTHVNGVWARSTLARMALMGAAIGEKAGRIRGDAEQSDIYQGSEQAMEQFPVNITQLYTEAKAKADAWYAGGTTFNNQVFGSASDPQIVVVTGAATFSGTTRGYGLLIVEGSLAMSDGFEWEGVVLARSTELDMSVVMASDATIYGALIARKGYDSGGSGGESSGGPAPPPQGELEFCMYNLDLNTGDTFNIREYVIPTVGNDPIDWSQVTFVYESQPTPANWHLDDFNAGNWVTVTAADAAPGTGNHGQGAYRIFIYRNGQSDADDHATIRVDDDATSGVVADRCGQPAAPPVAASESGSTVPAGRLRFTMQNNAKIFYSSEAIGKLAARLPAVKQASWIIQFDQTGENLPRTNTIASR